MMKFLKVQLVAVSALLNTLLFVVFRIDATNAQPQQQPQQNQFEILSDATKQRVLARLSERLHSAPLLATLGSSLAQLQSGLLTLRNSRCSGSSSDTALDVEALVRTRTVNDSQQLDTLLQQIQHATTQTLSTNASADQLEIQLSHKLADELCLDSSAIARLFRMQSLSDAQNDVQLAQVVLTQLAGDGCDLCRDQTATTSSPTHSTRFHTWLFAMIAGTLITLTSLLGALLRPITRHKHYKKVLMFLISLAIGTLSGTAFLHLIPQAFGISEDDKYSVRNEYIWKALVILVGLYLFFLVEQVMRFCIQFRKHRKEKQTTEMIELMNRKEAIGVGAAADVDQAYDSDVAALERRLSADAKMVCSVGSDLHRAHLSTTFDQTKVIAPVAWIIIGSEGLHNLIDGLSIGAAFSEGMLKGVSLSLAIICEEFPHKLGDFAILLAAGMTFRKALFCNFLTSSLIFAGIALGIVLGESLNANQWIYAVAAGMFIYIAVCDMIPELSEMSLEIEAQSLRESNKSEPNGAGPHFAARVKIQNIFIQHAGLLIGFAIMLLMALFSKKISF